MGVETAAAIALAAEASAGAAAAGTAGAALAGGAAASGALAGGAAAAGTAAGATAAGAGAASAAGAGLGAAEVAGAAAGAEAASAGGVAAAAGGVSPSSLALANTVSTFGGDGLSALIAAEGGFGSTSTMIGAAGDTFAGTAAGDLLKSAATNAVKGGGEAPAAKPAANVGPQTARPNQNPGLTQASQLMSPEFGKTSFQNGGQVAEMFPDNIFSRTRDRREQEAGTGGQAGGVTININSGSSGGVTQEKAVPRSEAQVPAFDQFANQLLNLIRSESKSGYADGGEVRDAESDVKAGGKIRGPQSKDGRDNQKINVAGGEGILPKDVMDVPGVSQMVQALIQTYHKPLK